MIVFPVGIISDVGFILLSPFGRIVVEGDGDNRPSAGNQLPWVEPHLPMVPKVFHPGATIIRQPTVQPFPLARYLLGGDKAAGREADLARRLFYFCS